MTDEQLQIWATKKGGWIKLDDVFYRRPDGQNVAHCPNYLTSHDSTIALVRKVCQTTQRETTQEFQQTFVDYLADIVGVKDNYRAQVFDCITATPKQLIQALYEACEGESK